ncbi:uncharacterized protein LOC117271873 isoform X3 [Epinephelus lanceolatus]
MLGGIRTDLLVTVTLLLLTQTGTQCRAEVDFSPVTLPDWRPNADYVSQCFYDRQNNFICEWTQWKSEDFVVTILESGPLGLEGEACLEFWYISPVVTDGSELRVLLRSSAGLKEIWTLTALPRDSWRQVFVPLNVIEPGTQAVVEAVSTSGQFAFNLMGVSRGQCGPQCESNTELWTDESTRCLCSSGQLSCSPSQCPEGQICGPQTGSSRGISTSGTCTIHSHTDCSTFDGVLFRFMAPCTYTLAKTCSPSEALPMFSVEVVNEQNWNSSLPTVQQVVVNVGKFRVSLLRRQTHRVVVNGVWRKLPLSLSSGTINIKSNPAAVELETSFGLSVSFDNAGAVHVKLPSTYSDKVCGLCGNFNHLRRDDFRKPDGTNAQDATALAKSWQTEENTSSCETILVPHQCDPQEEAEYASELYCGGLLSSTGPFAGCLAVLGAESYFRGCVVDMCTAHGDPAALCETLQVYADICQEAGVAVPVWRNSTFCPLQCGENSHYNSCADGCPDVCSVLDIVGSCGGCDERCECDSGFKLSGGKCVPAEDCGCWYSGKHYEKGATFSEGECVQQCQCMGNNEVQCTRMQCANHEVCKVKDGVKGCFPFKPATCSVYGDPHYITFDGMAYDFQGGCSYTLTTTCGGQSSVQFTVIGHNMHPPIQNFTRSKLEAMTLKVEDLYLTLNQSGKVYVKNRPVLLPYFTNGTYGSVWVDLKKNYIIMETTFGLRIMIDTQNRLFLQVDERYKYELCGLCGTYSDRQDDDFVAPEGQNATGPFEFGDSWRVPGNDECVSHPNDPRLCDYDQENEAYNECYTILGDAFKPCHESIHPSIYLNSCVYDYCATNGDRHTLCESLKSYAAACSVAGVELPHWQMGTACADPPTTATLPTSPVPTSPTPDQPFCPINCDFERNLCGWEQLVQDSFDWTRHSGPTPTSLTGPNQDHTTGAGYYMYIEGNSVTHGDSARLWSSNCHYNGPLCLNFWYHMYGSATAMALNIYLLKDKKATKLWSMRNNQGPEWHLGNVDIRVSGPFQIIVEGIRGSTDQSDVAIDDISIHFGACSGTFPGLGGGTELPPMTTEVLPSHSVCNMDCSFDSNLCSWDQMITDAFDWTWQSGSTPTLMTGPSADHTGDGHYLYIEASSVTYGDTSRLISSECSDSGPQCLQFWYHMYGSADTMGLHVYLLQNRSAHAVWRKRNDQGNMWHLAQVDITTTGAFQIIFEGRRGSNEESDVAIDDVKLYRGRCSDLSGGVATNPPSVPVPTTAAPEPPLVNVTAQLPDTAPVNGPLPRSVCNMDCSFDSNLCSWDQMITDAFDWTWQSGSTPTLMTGPSADHTGDGHYLYIEASSVTYGDTSRLISSECSDSGPQCLQFWYHMYGSADTMGLHVYLLQNRFAHAVWRKRNDQGNMWHLAQVDITTTGAFQIIFEGRRGSNEESDVAIDDVKLYRGRCSDVSGGVATNPPSVPVPTTAAPEPPLVNVTAQLPDSDVCNMDCSFDSNLCSWDQMITDAFDWTWQSGSTPTLMTGPSADHTGDGHYLYIEASSVTYGDTSRLISSECSDSGPQCLQFWYHMYGSADTMGLHVYLLQNRFAHAVWRKRNDQGNVWHLAQVDITTTGAFQIIFEGRRGSNEESDVAIDDVKLYRGRCSDLSGGVATNPPSVPVLTTAAPEPPLVNVTAQLPDTAPVNGPLPRSVCNMDCSFDSNLCSWDQMITDAFDWTWQSGSTPTLMTGPSADHTGDGHYLYIEASSVTYGDTSRLISSECSDSGPQCLQFWYHMYGSADTMGLHVYLLQNRSAHAVWRKRNDQGNMWHLAQVDITTTGAFQIIFEGRRGSNEESDVAIDDVKLYRGRCSDLSGGVATNPPSVPVPTTAAPEPPLVNVTAQLPDTAPVNGPLPRSVCNMDCSFDSNLCSWDQMITDAFDWTWQSGSTPTLMTGPSADHTGDGHYLYIEASSVTYGDTSRLISSECSDSGPQCLQFWYHMYGSADTMGLHVYLLQNRFAHAVWRKRNDQGNMWHLAQVDITTTGAFQIIFEGRRGSNEESDVAIDDVKLYRGRCSDLSGGVATNPPSVPVPTTAVPEPPLVNVTAQLPDTASVNGPLPHSVCNMDCSFDSNLCSWDQMITDAFDWTWQSGSTPTLMTGPSADHTGDGHYLYIEASSVTYGDTSRLISSECSDSGPQCLQFWYHMYGSADTMGLHVYLLQNRFAHAVWRKRNDQGNMWHLAQVDITTTGTFQIIFEGRRGSNEESDVAIDDVKLYRGRCSDMSGGVATNPPSVPVPTTAAPEPPLVNVTALPPVANVTIPPAVEATTNVINDGNVTVAPADGKPPHPVCQLNCNFEQDLCQWSQLLTDVFDWTRHSGSTPTMLTGPSSDHTTGGGHYLYIEANSESYGDTSRLISSECSDSGPQCLQFWYHMYGSADTMGLHVYLLQNNLAIAVWKKRNDQGNMWHLAQVDITTTGAFQIIFEGRIGSNDQSDVAIDDVSLHRGHCTDVAKPTKPAPSTFNPVVTEGPEHPPANSPTAAQPQTATSSKPQQPSTTTATTTTTPTTTAATTNCDTQTPSRPATTTTPKTSNPNVPTTKPQLPITSTTTTTSGPHPPATEHPGAETSEQPEPEITDRPQTTAAPEQPAISSNEPQTTAGPHPTTQHPGLETSEQPEPEITHGPQTTTEPEQPDTLSTDEPKTPAGPHPTTAQPGLETSEQPEPEITDGPQTTAESEQPDTSSTDEPKTPAGPHPTTAQPGLETSEQPEPEITENPQMTTRPGQPATPNEPQTSGGPQPQTTENQEPTAGSQPPTTARPQPPTTARPQPPSETQPQTTINPQPPTTAKPQPPTTARPQPPTTARPQPPTTARPQPPTTARPQPPSETQPQPQTTVKPQPPTTLEPQTTTTTPKPTTSAGPLPTTTIKPHSTTQRPEPTTTATPQSTTARPQPPTTPVPTPSCPANSHYTTCIPTCSPTCTYLNGPPRCSDDDGCVPGCVCDDGFVRRGRVCVPIQQCGCVDRNGTKHHFNEVWYTDHCHQKCECEKDDGVGEIDCDDDDECNGNAVCLQNEEGDYYCQSTGFSECTITGDPEYRTFDKMKHDFEGEHSYVLVRTNNLPNNLPHVYIEGINTAHDDDDSHHHDDSSSEEDQSRRVRDEDDDDDDDDKHDDDSDENEEHHRLQELKIRVYDHTVEFKKHRRLMVDGRRTNTPASPAAGLKIWERSSRIYLRTDFGLLVEFDGHSTAEITLPRTYKRKVGGLCGNFDGQKQNDLMKPDGTRARGVQEFGESWRV